MSCKRIARILALPVLLAGTGLLVAEPPAGLAGKSRPLSAQPGGYVTQAQAPVPPSGPALRLADKQVREVLEAFQRHMQHDAANAAINSYTLQRGAKLLQISSPRALQELDKNMIRGRTIHVSPEATRGLPALPTPGPKTASHRSSC